jgi:hypothetical protein
MPIQDTTPEAVATTSQTYTLSQFYTVTGTSNPTYLVVDALDRNEYTVGASGNTGDFSGNGATLGLTATGADGYGAGIVFTWQASTHQYVNTIYGAFNNLDFTSSSSLNDVTNISLFTTTNASLAQQDASNAYALMQQDAAGFAGSVTFVTDPSFSGSVPAAATPDGIAAAAERFVGQAWNTDGCWVLASTIAAEAGAGLPLQSTAIGIAGKPNGEWVVVYNGPGGSSGAWQNLVTVGDVVCFGTAGGGGHITTCVAGTGSTAQLVDNITYQNQNGQIQNAANDGSSKDILVSADHPASQEWAGVAAGSVVIYALDTPVVADKTAMAAVVERGTLALGTLLTATDPGHKSITKYQIYSTATDSTLMIGGHAVTATDATSAATLTSLATATLAGGATTGIDTVDVRAFNGTYWGDWQTLAVNITAPQAPFIAAQTPTQNWLQKAHVNFAVPTTVFKDPQGQALSYSATGANGASLPTWLSFNQSSHAFSGTVPTGMANFAVVVTATDTAGLSVSETFTVNVPAAAPSVTALTHTQSWAENSSVNFTLPGNTFTDPQGQALTLKATLSSGAALPKWLSFDPNTGIFSGTAPATAQTVSIKITATDTSNLAISETFAASIIKGTSAFTAADWSGTAHAIAAPATPAPAGGFFALNDAAVIPHFGLPHHTAPAAFHIGHFV